MIVVLQYIPTMDNMSTFSCRFRAYQTQQNLSEAMYSNKVQIIGSRVKWRSTNTSWHISVLQT